MLDELLASPTLPEVAEAINARLRAEAQRRQRFYMEMTDGEKVEFIGGEVVLHSPARHRHLEAKAHLAGLIGYYVRARGRGVVHDEKCLCVFPRNDYEPDVVYFGPEKAAGFRPDTLRFPIPDLVVEVLSEATEARDRGVKFADYEAHGVGEYWIVDPEAQVVEQYVNGPGGFDLVVKSSSGEIRSRVVDGLVVPIPAIFDPRANLAALRTLVAG